MSNFTPIFLLLKMFENLIYEHDFSSGKNELLKFQDLTCCTFFYGLQKSKGVNNP